LALRALGCRVVWLEAVDLDDSDRSAAGRRRRRGGEVKDCVATLKARLAPYGFADAVALCAINGAALPGDLAQGCLDLAAAAEADLLLNLWHSLPAHVVRRFRRSTCAGSECHRFRSRSASAAAARSRQPLARSPGSAAPFIAHSATASAKP